MAVAAPTNALKGQFNSAQWQRLGFMAIAAPTNALKGQLNLCDVYVLSCPFQGAGVSLVHPVSQGVAAGLK